MDLRELKAQCRQEITEASGYDGGELSDSRRRALEYYLGEPFGNEVEGRSSVVSTDVADVVEWVMPSLMKVFASGDDVVRCEPQGPEDVEMAQQATDYLNYVFNRQNEGFSVLYDWFKDALIQKVGVVKVWWEESERREREQYSGLNDIELEALKADDAVEIVSQESIEATIEMQGPDGTSFEVMETTHDVEIIRTVPTGQVRVMAVPPEEFLINKRARTIEDARFVCHRTKKPISDLRQMGYEVPDDVGSSDEDEWNEERVARMEFDDADAIHSAITEKSMREVWVHECYVRVDFDDDGIAELRKVTLVGDLVLDNEEVDAVPFASITPIKIPHKFHGLSLADLVMDLQLVKSTIMRNLLDNAYQQNFGRYAVLEGQVNLDDLLTARPGGVVRVRSPGAVSRLDTPSLEPYTFQMLDYLDGIREERSGVSRNGQGLNEGALKSHQTASGVAQVMSAAQQRVELIARVFAETGVRELFRKMYRLVIKHEDQEKFIRLRGEFIPVQPMNWNDNPDLTVTVGLGYGNKDQNLMHLTQIAQMYQMVAANGGVGTLIQPINIYNLMTEILKNSGIKNVNDFVTPVPPGPLPEQPDIQQQALEMEAQLRMQELQIKMQEAQLDSQIKQQEMELKKEEAAINYQVKRQELAIKKQELGLKQAEAMVEMQTGRAVAFG
jgi:hypothetical protein